MTRQKLGDGLQYAYLIGDARAPSSQNQAKLFWRTHLTSSPVKDLQIAGSNLSMHSFQCIFQCFLGQIIYALR